MRRSKTMPEWLEGVTLRGFDDDDDGSGDGDGDEGGDDDDDGDDDGDEGGQDGKDTSGLKSALRKERRARKAAERERNALKKQQEGKEQKDQDDLTRAQTERDAERQRTAKLAAKLAEREVDSEIRRLASKMKFIDPDDAVQLIDREVIEVDQDEDDPAEVRVDRDSVQDALNELKKNRPHLLIADGDEERSGGKFGGNRNRNTGKETDQQRRDREIAQYGALRHRRQSTTNNQ